MKQGVYSFFAIFKKILSVPKRNITKYGKHLAKDEEKPCPTKLTPFFKMPWHFSKTQTPSFFWEVKFIYYYFIYKIKFWNFVFFKFQLDSGDKKISRKEKDERILWKKNEVAEYESTTFSIFYNNALFLAILIVCSFYILRSFSPVVNYVGAMTMAAGVVALLSTGSQ